MRTILVLITLASLLSCKKNADAPQTDNVKRFEACACSDTSSKALEEDYISATIEGVPICFDVTPPGMVDTFPNFLRHGFIKRDTGDQYFDCT